MEDAKGSGAWPYTNLAKRRLVTALEEMWREAEKGKYKRSRVEEEEIDYATLAEMARCIMSAVEVVVASRKMKSAGAKREYRLYIEIENGKVAWQLTGDEAEADELPGPGPVPHLIFKVSILIFIMLRIGYHVSIAKSIDLSFDRAKELGCTAMQLFVTNPRSWTMKRLSKEEKERFIEKQSYNISAVAHMPYLPNLASPREEVYKESKRALKENIERCNELGINMLITHLGSTLGEEKDPSKKVAEAIGEYIDIFEGTILLENEAGQRNSVGSKMEELKDIYDLLKSNKVGFCFDTCHAFASGYDIRDTRIMKKIERLLGKERIKVVHLNDAKYPLGSGKDRHQNIGLGYIGEEGFRRFFENRWLAEKNIILETPYSSEISPYEELALARKLAGC